MGRYLIRRFLFLLLVLVMVSFVTFGIFFKLPPGDPARRAAGRKTTADIIATARHNLGLNRPWYVQYWRFAVGASVIWILIGLPIGIASAVKPRSVRDRAGMLFALFGVSAPSFWLGYLFLFVFWFKLGWFPGSTLPIGQTVTGAVVEGRFILPWVVLSLLFAAFYARMVRSNLIETMSEDYIRTARAKGLSERRVIYKHGLRA